MLGGGRSQVENRGGLFQQDAPLLNRRRFADIDKQEFNKYPRQRCL